MRQPMHPDCYFPSEPTQLNLARKLFTHVSNLPIKAETTLAAEAFLDPASQLRLEFERLNFNQLITHQTPLCRIETFEDLKSTGFGGKLTPLYVADNVTDPQAPNFVDNLDTFGTLTNCDAYTWKGYLEAHRVRRELFKLYGATALRCHPPSAQTLKLDPSDMITLFRKVCIGKSTPAEAAQFCAAMLYEFAKMSLDDGLDLQIQAGGTQRLDYTTPLNALLQDFGNSSLKIVILTHDEAAISTELAPLTSQYSALHLGLSPNLFTPYRLRKFRAITADINQIHPIRAFSDELQNMVNTTDSIRRLNATILATRIAQHEISEDDGVGLMLSWVG
jgi:glucuronate isomerase